MSRFAISHTTNIEAPMEFVWKHLVDIDDWEGWNQWTRLKAPRVQEGTKGKLRACYKGDNREWKTFDFEFGALVPSNAVAEDPPNPHCLLTWKGSVGPRGCLFTGHHTIQLERIDSTRTRLIHQEHFGGLLPTLGLGLPYSTLDQNYLKMNLAFKQYVEALQK